MPDSRTEAKDCSNMAKSKIVRGTGRKRRTRSQSSIMPSRLKSKPPQISKTTKKPTNGKLRPATPFRFLDLPVELRDNIYQMVLDAEPEAYLSKRFRGRLITRSALAWVNRGIRSEFLSTVYVYAGNINAVVKDFDFQHIVTFLNRLSDKEMRLLVDGPSSRCLNIELSFSSTFTGNVESEAFHLLDRWLRRLQHPTKKGTNVLTTYTVCAADKVGLQSLCRDRGLL